MVDLTTDENGPVKARLLDLVQGRTRAAYADWLEARGQDFTDGVDVATLDPFQGYRSAIDEAISDATAVLDAFHVVALGTRCVDEVRRRVQQATTGHRGRKGDPLYGIQTILRAGAENLTDKQRARIERAFAAREEHEAVDLTWQCAQQLRTAYKHVDKTEGRKIAERIVATFPSCPVPEIARLGRTLRKWKNAFLAYFDTGATNGGTEAIIIWSPAQAVLDVTDDVPPPRRRHVIWRLSPTVPTAVPWSWLAFRLSICTAQPRQRHVFEADPLVERSRPPALQITVNGLIKLHRRIARGLTNFENYRLRMLLIGGGLNL